MSRTPEKPPWEEAADAYRRSRGERYAEKMDAAFGEYDPDADDSGEVAHHPPASASPEQTELVIGEGHDHALARTSDPTTSHLADAALRAREGEAQQIRKNTHRHLALECFVQRGPLTAEDVKVVSGVDGIWKRVSDLKNGGFIEATGYTKVSREGREVDIYRATPLGRATYAALGPCA